MFLSISKLENIKVTHVNLTKASTLSATGLATMDHDNDDILRYLCYCPCYVFEMTR